MSDSIPHPSSSGKGNPKDGDQYREYYIPVNIVREEQELLDEFGTDRLAHALREIYNDFYLMIELMRGYAERKDDEDYTYWLLALKLQQPLDRLSKACSVTVDWELVMTRSIGVEIKA